VKRQKRTSKILKLKNILKGLRNCLRNPKEKSKSGNFFFGSNFRGLKDLKRMKRLSNCYEEKRVKDKANAITCIMNETKLERGRLLERPWRN
jgi:hypothetical protein